MSKFRTIFSHPRCPTIIEGDSLARSEFADDCDLRTIIQRHSMQPPSEPRYLDLTLLGDGLHDVLEFSRYVASEFDALPLPAREYFDYDPSRLVEFVSDDSNRDKAVELGLLPPPPPPSNPEN